MTARRRPRPTARGRALADSAAALAPAVRLPRALSERRGRAVKTAVSLPNDVFRAAERHARRARKSRSQLYAEALSEYLSRHAPDEVTEAMNHVIDQLKEPTDPFVTSAARRILERSESQGEVWWADLPEPAGSVPGFRRSVMSGIDVVLGR